MRYADLHLHSTYSDGTMTVPELCDSAVAHGVSVIAITDHNCVGGVLEAIEYAKELPLTVIPGVEIDAQFGDRVYHILGLNISVPLIEDFVSRNLAKQEDANRRMVEAVAQDDARVNIADYDKFERGKGGWKALHYLRSVGVTSGLMDAMPLYGKYGVTPLNTGFAHLSEVCEAILKAGGFSVIAHPIPMDTYGPIDDVLNRISEAVTAGIMGVECFYPSFTIEQEETLYRYCVEKNLHITGGSDCHGDFFSPTKQLVGSHFIELDKLRL